jgi:membrane protease YdiL (CAAX protease family)
MREFITRYPVLTFVLLTLGYQFVVVGVVWAMIPEGQVMHDNATAWMIFRFRVFGPLAFAMGLTWYLEGRAGLKHLFASFLRWKVPAKWYLIAFSWKFVFTWVGIGTLAVLGIREWPGLVVPDFFTGTNERFWEMMRVGMPFIIGIAFVEETAWMKFCVTRMQERYSAFASCVLVGIAWGLWYLPMLLIGEGVPDGYPWPVFMVSMICLTILLGWAYNMTRSGTILLVMQIVSNSAFFMIPVLPGWWDNDPTYVNSFVAVNALSATLLVLIYGWRELGTRKRAKWSEDHQGEHPLEHPGAVKAAAMQG